LYNVITLMLDTKLKVKLIRRGSGYLIYIPKSILKQTGVDLEKISYVKRYPTKDKQIILRFS